jgi:hypothetical protein
MLVISYFAHLLTATSETFQGDQEDRDQEEVEVHRPLKRSRCFRGRGRGHRPGERRRRP